MARVPYVTDDDLPNDQKELLGSYHSMQREFVPHIADPTPEYLASRSDRRPHVYGALGNNPDVLGMFREMASAIRGNCGLSEYRRELVILTVARTVRAEYEWHQHVPIALAGDVTEDEIHAISAGRTDVFADPEAALVAYAAHFATGAITDADHHALADYFDPDRIVGTNVLAGSYLSLAHQLDALGVETEEPFVGWELENLSVDA